MSAENVALAIGVYEAMARGEIDRVFEMVDPEIEWETSPNLPDAGVYRGREEIRAFLVEQREVVWGGNDMAVEIERALDCGDDVLLFLRVRGKGSHTGIPLDVRIANLVTIRDGKAVRVKVFPDRQEALEAVGLKE